MRDEQATPRIIDEHVVKRAGGSRQPQRRLRLEHGIAALCQRRDSDDRHETFCTHGARFAATEIRPV